MSEKEVAVSNVLAETVGWFIEAVREPTPDNKLVQIGVHIEEFAEMLEAIGLKEFAADVQRLGMKFKQKLVTHEQLNIDMKELLDSLTDQIVTACGIAHMFGMDIVGALGEVNRSNYSKFVDGRAIFDENGKIKKGPGFFRPDLTPFLPK